MHTHTLSVNWKNIIASTILVVALIGCFSVTTKAQAASADALITESLPSVHATAQLVLGALKEKISAEPQLAAATVTDPQIAALMKLLEQLMAMYQAILAAQGGDSDSGDDDWDDDTSYSRTPVITSASLYKGSGTSYIRVRSRHSEDVIKLEYRANCCKATEGTLDPWKANSADEGLYLLDTYLGNVRVDNLKIRMVTSSGAESRWFEVAVDNEDEEPSSTEVEIDADFSSSMTYGSVNGVILYASFDFEIENSHQGLVLDVEPAIGCGTKLSDSGRVDCSGFVFDISAKAMESYHGVPADPYVKGGALYRLTWPVDNVINISGYRSDRYNYSEPDYVDLRFVLRDIDRGGAEVWSRTERVWFKG